MIMTIVVFQYQLESSTSNAHGSIPFMKIVASVTIGCKPSKVTILTKIVDLAFKVLSLFTHLFLKITNLCLLFSVRITNEVHQKSDSLACKWFGVDVCHVAVCWYLHHIEAFAVLNPQQLAI